MKPTVTFYGEDSNLQEKVTHPKNLGWLIKNMKHVEVARIKPEGLSGAILEVSGSRKGKVFKGIFPFASLEICRIWCHTRAHFQHIGVEGL